MTPLAQVAQRHFLVASAAERGSDINAEPPAEHPLLPRVRLALRQTGYLHWQRVECEFHDGVLIPRGEVPTFFLKQVAQMSALRVPDVERVENHLKATGC